MANPLNILMVIPSLPVGGAEWAFVRLANALAADHKVTAYVPYRCDSSPGVFNSLKNVAIRSLPLPHPLVHSLLYKLTLLLNRVAPSSDLEQRIHSWVLRSMHRVGQFDVINPHLRSAAVMVCKAFEDSTVPIVEHDHGDYALFRSEGNHPQGLALLMKRIDAVVCPSRHNSELLSTYPWRLDFQCTIIPNSMPAAIMAAPRTDPTFTFGMVARGMKEKGWAEAIAAFRLARERTRKPMRLVLVGEGDHLKHLKQTVADDEPVVFTGCLDNPAVQISGFDVGLLPSYFAAESLPCAIIEYLTLGKPVIATAVGGIPDMLESPEGPCGILVALAPATGRADVMALALAMTLLAQDDTLRQTMAVRASNASLYYDASTCAKACADFFRRIQALLRLAAAPSNRLADTLKVI